MNIIDIQDQLKNFSEQQLVSEMQSPTGSAPQFLVLSEIKRRKRVRDDFAKREAAQQPTVAQEAVASAGVPQSGIAGMAEAMAPKSTMVQKAMRSGGLMQFGAEIQRSLAEKTKNEQIDPFLDEVEQMAQTEFGVDSGSFGSGQSIMPVPNFPNQGFPAPTMGTSMPNPFGRTRTGGKGGAMLGMNRMANMAAQSKPVAELQVMPSPVQKYDEGGVVRASIGAFFNPDGTPTEAGLRALIGQESGGDPTARGSVDEIGLTQIRPGTAIMPGYGVQSMFPEIASLIGPGKKYDTNKMKMADAVQKAYEDNRELIDSGLIDPDRSTAFSRDYLTAMSKQFPDDPNRALAAYNVGPGTAAELENPAEFDYVTKVLGRMGDGSDKQKGAFDTIASNLANMAKSLGTAASEAVIPTAAASGPVMTEVEKEKTDTKVRDFEGRVIGDTSLGPRLRENPDPGSYQYDPETGEVIGDTMAPEERRLLNEAINMGRDFEMRYRDRDPDDLTGGVLGSGAITGSTAGMFPDQIAEVQPLPGSTDVNRASASEAPVLQAGSQEDKITFPDQTTTTNVEGDTTTVEGDTTTVSPTTIVGGESGTYDASGLAAEIKSLQEKLDKDRETDKYLALAQAGLALMSSKEPTLLGAVGEAGISGLTAFREAQDRYQEGVVDLINARAKLKSKTGSAFTQNQMIQRAKDLQAMAATATENGNIQRARELTIAADTLLSQAGLIESGGINEAFADQ